MKKWNKAVEQYISTPFDNDNIITGITKENASTVILRLMQNTTKTIVVFAPQLVIAEELLSALELWRDALKMDLSIELLLESFSNELYLPENETARTNILYKLLTNPPNIIITTATAALSPTPTPDFISKKAFTLHRGDEISFDKLLSQLVDMDFDDEFEVNIPGEFSKRGGIIDIYSPAEMYPARLEFWGDEIESMRIFATNDQRSIEDIKNYTIIPCSSVEYNDNLTSNFFDWLDLIDTKFVSLFPKDIDTHIQRFSSDDKQKIFIDKLANKSNSVELFKEQSKDNQLPECYPSLKHIIIDNEENNAQSIFQAFANRIHQWLDTEYSVTIIAFSEGGLNHIKQWCKDYKLKTTNIKFVIDELPYGILLPVQKHVILTERDIFSLSRQQKFAPAIAKSAKMQDFKYSPEYIEMNENDYAVHLTHGICVFKGIKKVMLKELLHEVIELEFANDISMFVPLQNAAVIHRYIGSQKNIPTLSKLNTNSWSNKRKLAEDKIKKMAMEMIRIQAVRNSINGFAFQNDDIEQKLFEEAFPFTATKDQLTASEEIKYDMSQPKPMDRLLCGDVGYGKTEVAMRAVFKAVSSGKQVAILVPTTILAQQHYYSFVERFNEYPYTIEMLSRFKTKKNQLQVIENLKSGGVDIVIGTHRLVQDDIQFKDLGLVIVDEEQRFGVTHKEKLKKLRTTVDVLVMTATPIPRTLHLSMVGVRDLSTIMSPPYKRLPIKTIVSEYDDKIIVNAIEQELQRDGQVFFLHNRVKTIEQTTENLQTLMPNVKFKFAHGQMNESELEDIMNEFIDHKIDVLVSTTIIESGLDIPNANTIIIDRADRFGLAALYQLRGRVGRWIHQAYSYFLLPKHGMLSGSAKKRIAAVRKYTELSVGFKLALKDLEIRGAGNILGSTQSGAINNIGFELYCQLLQSEIANLQGKNFEILPEVLISFDFIRYAICADKETVTILIPDDYILSDTMRLAMYKKLADFINLSDIKELKEAFIDKYGPIPKTIKTLFDYHTIRIMAASLKIDSIVTLHNKFSIKNKNGKTMLSFDISQFKNKLKAIIEILKELKKSINK